MTRRPEALAGGLALVLSVALWVLVPHAGTDLAAQLARASFAREAPLTPVDLSWYGGVHPFSYSLLSPWVMAVLGVHVAGVLAAVVGAVLLARLLRGSQRPLLGAVLGAVFVSADLASGRTTFALGLAAGLGALCALPRRGVACALGILTALLSPVAAAFLGLAAAVLVLHRRGVGLLLGLAAAVPVLLLASLFPSGGVQPYTGTSARPAVVCAAALAVLTSSPLVRTGAVLYGLAVLGFLLHDDPFGSNVLRLGLLLAAPLLVATARPLAGLPGRGALVAAVGFALLWQAGPPLGDLRAPRGPSTAELVSALQAQGAVKVEALAPRDHRESANLVEHVLLARGWSRQVDRAENPLFYAGDLTAEEWVDWLSEQAVDHVAVPLGTDLDFGSDREAALLATGVVPGLEQVWQGQRWRLYRLVHHHPLAPDLVSADRRRVVLRVTPGLTGVAVRWSPWLSASGPACLERVGDRVRLRVRSAGEVVLTSSLRPRGRC